MNGLPRMGWVLTLAVLGLAGLPPSSSHAQFSGAGGFSDAFSNNAQSGMLAARFPAKGDWAEVITVTPKWIVIQNQNGQQFPISVAGVQLFVMRWPITLDKVAPNALLETTGIDRGTNQIVTDHIDVYEGTANQLGVVPTVQTIVGYNRLMTAFDIDQHNTYGIDYFRFLTPDELALPIRLHVAGPIVDVNPLRLAVGGGISIAVFPASDAFFMTQVTPGTPALVRKGDLVYYVPREPTPKSLNLAQLVVYKSIPLSQFSP